MPVSINCECSPFVGWLPSEHAYQPVGRDLVFNSSRSRGIATALSSGDPKIYQKKPGGFTTRVIHADQRRNPTLSYTQRLEERIKELEDQLSKSQSQALSQAQPHASERPMSTSFDGSYHGHESGEGLTGTFRELKLDERGVLTYHGATSFFHLPSEYTGQEIDAPSSPLSEDPVNGRRERLVNNAWQQRALEDLSEIPVSKPTIFSPCSSYQYK